MKVLKHTMIALLISLGLAQSQAQAGLIVGVLAGAATGNAGAGAAIGAGVGGAAAIGVGIANEMFDDELGTIIWTGIILIPGVVLESSFDARSSLSQLESALHQSLPMIEDREVIQNIARAAQKKLVAGGRTLAQGEKRVIRFNDAELEALTDSLVLSGAEQDEVKRVLQ